MAPVKPTRCWKGSSLLEEDHLELVHAGCAWPKVRNNAALTLYAGQGRGHDLKTRSKPLSRSSIKSDTFSRPT